MKSAAILTAFFFLCSMGAVSCTSGQSVVGTWQAVNGIDSITFLKDGTFTGKLLWDMTKQQVDVAGTYAKKGELVNLNLNKPANLAAMTWKVSISGTEMTVTFQQGGALKVDGSSLKYRRTS